MIASLFIDVEPFAAVLDQWAIGQKRLEVQATFLVVHAMAVKTGLLEQGEDDLLEVLFGCRRRFLRGDLNRQWAS